MRFPRMKCEVTTSYEAKEYSTPHLRYGARIASRFSPDCSKPFGHKILQSDKRMG